MFKANLGALLFMIAAVPLFQPPAMAFDVPAGGAEVQDQSTSQYLTPVNDALDVSASGHVARYKFGSLLLIDSGIIEHVFDFKNTGKHAIIVERTQPSCSCTSAQILPGKHSTPVTLPTEDINAVPGSVALAPGDRVQVKVDVDADHLAPGEITKSVLLFVQGQDAPAAEMIVQGTIDRGVTFDRGMVDFGAVKSSSVSSQPLTVSIDKRLEDGGAVVQVVSTNPTVSVATVVDDFSAAVSPANVHMLHLNIVLTHPYIGSLGSMESGLSVVRTFQGVRTTLSDLDIPLAGTVTGSFETDKHIVLFPVQAKGQQGIEKAVFTSNSPGGLEGVSAVSDNPAVIAKWESATAEQGIVSVSIADGTPSGSLRGNVIVTNRAGERLRLPVYTYVVGNRRK